MTQYLITTHTGDIDGAGTDCDIKIRIFGDRGETGWRILDNPDRNDFERNSTDSFLFDLPNVGNIHEVRIAFSYNGPNTDWYLDWINVNDLFLSYKKWIRLPGEYVIGKW
jgi:lipoxygenase homology domain-containing protein 1